MQSEQSSFQPKSLGMAGLCFPAIQDTRFVFISNPIIIEFLLGCLAGHIYLLSAGKYVFTGLLFMIAAAVILFANFWFGYGGIDSAIETADGHLSWQRVAYWGSASFFLVAGCLLLNRRYGKLIPHWLVVLGDSSYAAYLIHLLCINGMMRLFKRAGFTNPDGFIMVSIAFTLIMACLVHRIVERPLQRYLSKKMAPARWYPVRNKSISENA